MSEEEKKEEIQLPDRAFFDACVEGNEEQVRSVIEREEEFEWRRLFLFRFIVQGKEIEVCTLILFFLVVYLFLFHFYRKNGLA